MLTVQIWGLRGFGACELEAINYLPTLRSAVAEVGPQILGHGQATPLVLQLKELRI